MAASCTSQKFSQSVTPAFQPVRRFLCLRWVQRRVFLGFCKKEDFYEKTIAQHDTGPQYDADHSAGECHNGVCGE